MIFRRLVVVLLITLTMPFTLQAKNIHIRLDPSAAPQPVLRKALLALDQQGHGPLDAEAMAKFKVLMTQYGWPTVVAAGREGVNAAGDLLLRSRADYDFQNTCLEQVFHQIDVDTNARAVLTLNDRIEAEQGHPQQGGMLFAIVHGKVVLSPSVGSLTAANGFRMDYGLPTVADDLRHLQTAVDSGMTLAAATQTPQLATVTHPIRMPALRAELSRMTAQDQKVRNAYIQSGMKNGSPEQKRVIAVDAANLSRLHTIFAKYGFPSRAMVGRDGVSNAWLLVQHASTDKPFMSKALKLARPLMLNGDLSRSNYALLVDRVRLQQGGKQVYGSQLRGKPGHFVVLPLEDPAHVDQRRASMGLQPLAAYIAQTNAAYTPKISPAKPADPNHSNSTMR